LIPNVYLSEAAQAAQLLADCGVTVSAKQGVLDRRVNVFNSSDIKSTNLKDDPDLGSPNQACLGGGPGVGNGGNPNATFPNCAPLGNLLIIQDPRADPNRANDSPFGGCIIFEFSTPIEVVNTGILDVEEAGVSITVR
jgi:hypothetical protein